MKKIVLIAGILLIAFNSFSQTPYRKKVIHRVTNKLVEEYDVIDSTSTIKNGYYARYNPNGKIRKTGNYLNNARTGVWTFYTDSAKLLQKYNYSTGLGLFVPPDTLAKSFLKQANVDTNFYKGVQTPPVFVGGETELRDFLQQNLRYPVIARQSGIEGNVIATFFVNSNGFIELPKIVKTLGYGCEEEVIRIISLMPRWIPAIKQGSDTRQQYYMVFKFELKK